MGNRIGNWIETYSGVKFYPLDPRPDEILIIDIAHALSNICRFNGHCKNFYSVAQHSVIVAMNLPIELALYGLLHDASEAYMCDIISPIKQDDMMRDYVRHEGLLKRFIYEKFGLAYEPNSIGIFDARALATEKRDLLNNGTRWEVTHEGMEIVPFNEKIVSFPPDMAKELFLNRFEILINN